MSQFDKLINIYSIRANDTSLPDHKKVGWGSRESQWLRFKVLSEISDLSNTSVLDLGCGIGDLITFFDEEKIQLKSYQGIDITAPFIDTARDRFRDRKSVSFEVKSFEALDLSNQFDYVLLSGALNLRFGDNLSFAKETLRKMYAISRRGVAINFLTKYVDFENPKDFHYSPEEMFTFARTLTTKVTLRHDYPLYEFTLYLYKDI